MKKLIRNGFAILALAAVMTSCSSDDQKDEIVKPGTGLIDPNNLKGEFKNQQITLDSSKEYKLTGKLVIGENSTLTIPKGTRIVGHGGTSAYIAIAQGGKIFVNGTKESPVVMTGAEMKRGNWGGLVICGKAPINKGTSATAEVSDLIYGGTDAKDNSGSISYLRVEYAGAIYNSGKEFNGISFFGVGSGTVIEYVQAHEGSDDGFEFFGGTVNTKYMVSSHNDDDQFDWTEGWSGTNEFWYSKQSGVADKGIEADNNSDNQMATPIANPTIKGLTLISSEPGKGTAFKLREGTRANFDNVVLSGWKTGFEVEHDATLAQLEAGNVKAVNVKYEGITEKSAGYKTFVAGGENHDDKKGKKVDVSKAFTESSTATGAGNGTGVPEWAKGWTVGL